MSTDYLQEYLDEFCVELTVGSGILNCIWDYSIYKGIEKCFMEKIIRVFNTSLSFFKSGKTDNNGKIWVVAGQKLLLFC